MNFGYAGVWSVGCRSILLEKSSWEFLIVQLIYKGVEDFHICSCFDGCIEDGTNYAPPGHTTPNTNLLWMRRFFMYWVGIFTWPNTGILRISVSRQVKPRLVREPSVVLNARTRVRQETGWLAGGPLLRVATIRRTTDTFLFISHITNILLFKFRYNSFIGVRIIKEIPGSVASGTSISKATSTNSWSSTVIMNIMT